MPTAQIGLDTHQGAQLAAPTGVTMILATCAGCSRPSATPFCLVCETSVLPAPPGLVWAAWAYEGAVANAVVSWKERHHEVNGLRLIEAATPKLAARFSAIDVVVAIPPAFFRTLWRGFHPADAWAQAAARALGARCEARALRRIDSTRQMGASREERQKRKLFAATRRVSELQGKRLLIVDDVTTSGATMRAAAVVLSACDPASLQFAALASVR